MSWEFKSGIPIYIQIINQVKIRIAGGEYFPGSRLPSVRDFAMQAGVNPNTMQRALTDLEQEGLIYANSTSGRYVTEDEGKLRELKRDLCRSYIDEMFRKLEDLGMEPDEIIEMVRRRGKGECMTCL